MSVLVLKLDLAPPSNPWRNNHVLLGWAALALGALVLAGSLALTWVAYRSAAISGRLAGSLANKTRSTAETQARILTELRSVDVTRELPRWRLAERIYTERSLPWSRLTSELERCMVKDMRVKSVQRNRSNDQRVQLKLKGEARSREAEAAFVEALQKNPFFDQVILEREGERQGGGVDFDYTLSVAANPPPYQPLPKGPAPGKAVPVPARAAVPAPAGAPARTIAVPPPPPPRAVPAAPAPAEANPGPTTTRLPGGVRPFRPGRPTGRRMPTGPEVDQ